ncbi:hypothetical protein EON66_06110 [archaeon]|nr:MAG: hypothetical protein EON66_06110 [archaeon]
MCAPPAATTGEDELPAAAGSGEARAEEHAEDAAEEGALEEEGEGEEEVVNPFPDVVYADGRVIRRTRRVPDEADELPDEKKDADMATAFKEEGNRNFGGANFDAAVGCYTEALKHLPRDTSYSTQRAIFYANRAACYIKQVRYRRAGVRKVSMQRTCSARSRHAASVCAPAPHWCSCNGRTRCTTAIVPLSTIPPIQRRMLVGLQYLRVWRSWTRH